MTTDARPRSSLTTDDMVEIRSRMRSYNYGENAIRTIDESGERWLIFADVCKALGYKNSNHASKRIDLSEKRKVEIGLKNTLAVGINRRGLLSFVLFSNKPETAKFMEWAEKEVFNDERR